MTKGRFYMHKNGMDVCLHVLSRVYTGTTKLKFKARWVNLGYTGSPWTVWPACRIEIQKRAVNDWKDVTSKISIPRSQPGVPV